MKLTEIHVDAFGAWTDLQLAPLTPGLTVLYGPNEAGKTTLMQFVRAMFYGFSPARRARYFPPLCGRAASGTLTLNHETGRYLVERRDESATGGDPLGTVHLLHLDAPLKSSHQEEITLPELLSQVDESVFQNLFALGLDDIGQLSSLSDTQASALLYRLSAGLDRVSLVEVVQQLKRSRLKLWSADNPQCEMAELLAERQRLRQAIAGHSELVAQYTVAHHELQEVKKKLSSHTEQTAELNRQLRLYDVAASLFEPYHHRHQLREELTSLGRIPRLPARAEQRLADIHRQTAAFSEQSRQHKEQYRQAAASAKKVAYNPDLLRQGPRIAVLVEQLPWIETLETRIDKLTEETLQLESKCQMLRRQSGLSDSKQAHTPKLTPREVASWWSAAKQAKTARKKMLAARKEFTSLKNQIAELDTELQSALRDRPETDLTTAATEAGRLVTHLRRRIQLKQRVDQLEHERGEATLSQHEMLDAQMLSGKALIAVGVVFVLGVVLLLGGFLLPLATGGSTMWSLALLGLVCVGGSAGGKYYLEYRQTQQLDSAQQQTEMVNLQLTQAQEELRQLNRQLPVSEHSDEHRLTAAQEELARLENLLPVSSQQATLHEQASAVRRRMKRAKHEFETGRKRWSQGLAASGLPADLQPSQVRAMTGALDEIQHLMQRLEDRQEDLMYQQSAYDVLNRQVQQLLVDSRIKPTGKDLHSHLRQLNEALREQHTLRDKRREFVRQARQARRRYLRAADQLQLWKRRRRHLLADARVKNETQFRDLLARAERRRDLRQQLSHMELQLQRGRGEDCTEENLQSLLADHDFSTLKNRQAQLQQQHRTWQTQSMELAERRGQLLEQIKHLAADRTLGDQQVELAEVEAQLATATFRWQALSVASLVLLSLREEYEQNRQPETLQQASVYFSQLTEGRYRRVWTPLEEDSLLVEDRAGRTLRVDVLSRGTREQLFLSLRLALARWYAQNGADLPLVLDDLLVNFDSARARQAAQLLCDFAAHHQLLVFTCHEHIAELFQSLSATVRRLPSRENRPSSPLPPPIPVPVPVVEPVVEVEPEPEVIEEAPFESEETVEPEPVAVEPVKPPKEKPKRPKKKRRTKPATEPEPEEAVVEEVEEPVEEVEPEEAPLPEPVLELPPEPEVEDPPPVVPRSPYDVFRLADPTPLQHVDAMQFSQSPLLIVEEPDEPNDEPEEILLAEEDPPEPPPPEPDLDGLLDDDGPLAPPPQPIEPPATGPDPRDWSVDESSDQPGDESNFGEQAA